MRLTSRRLGGDCRGSTAVEFALVLPLLLLLLFGIIDAGRLMWEVNRAEKATQMGARYAIVTDIIPAEIVNADYVGTNNCTREDDGLCQDGDFIDNVSALGTLRCTATSCTCTGTCPEVGSLPSFQQLVDRMRAFDPSIAASNVVVSFRGSGLGFAGDPTGMDIAPLVTVELSGLQFTPVTLLALTTFTLPAFRTTLSAESSSGSQAN